MKSTSLFPPELAVDLRPRTCETLAISPGYQVYEPRSDCNPDWPLTHHPLPSSPQRWDYRFVHQVQWAVPAFRWKTLWARCTWQGIAGYWYQEGKTIAKLVLRICVLSELWVESLELVKLYFFLPASRIEFTLVQRAHDTVQLSCFVKIGRSHYFSLRNLQSN